MCGIAGIIGARSSRDALVERLQRLQHDLHHRGPDDAGVYVSGDARASDAYGYTRFVEILRGILGEEGN